MFGSQPKHPVMDCLSIVGFAAAEVQAVCGERGMFGLNGQTSGGFNMSAMQSHSSRSEDDLRNDVDIRFSKQARL